MSMQREASLPQTIEKNQYNLRRNSPKEFAKFTHEGKRKIMVFKKKIIKIFPMKSRTLFCIFFCLLSPSNNSNFSKILITLHTTAPEQYLHVPSAPCAFTLSFHSSPQSVLHVFLSIT